MYHSVVLAGQDDRITDSYELTNAEHSAVHFTLLPEEQFAAVKDIRAKGLKLTAVWHSHPATPARMSDEGLRLAYTPGIAHVIVSLVSPSDPEIRAFRVEEAATELELVVCLCSEAVNSEQKHRPTSEPAHIAETER